MITSQQLADALKATLRFRHLQRQSRKPPCLASFPGRDTFVIMPTGGGKSLCYQLPALLSEGHRYHYLSPDIALMKNQVDAIRHFSENDSVAHFLNSSLSKSAIDAVKADILAGKTKMLYVAPESLTKDENIEFLKSVPISFYAVDGRTAYRSGATISDRIPAHPSYHHRDRHPPVIALTATATAKVQHDIQKNPRHDRCRRLQIVVQPRQPLL